MGPPTRRLPAPSCMQLQHLAYHPHLRRARHLSHPALHAPQLASIPGAPPRLQRHPQRDHLRRHLRHARVFHPLPAAHHSPFPTLRIQIKHAPVRLQALQIRALDPHHLADRLALCDNLLSRPPNTHLRLRHCATASHLRRVSRDAHNHAASRHGVTNSRGCRVRQTTGGGEGDRG